MAVIKQNQSSLCSKPSITGLPRSTSIKTLGVTIDEKLSISEHINQVVKTGSASIFALKTLKNHGASTDSLQLITRATIIARTMYASPAWWGLANEKDKSRLEQLMNRLNRSGFTHTDFPSAKVLANVADTSLFKAVLLNENHALRCLFPNQHFTPYFLRARPHNFNLPNKERLTKLYLECYSLTLTKLLPVLYIILLCYLAFPCIPTALCLWLKQ
jgi:hypothetical protein